MVAIMIDKPTLDQINRERYEHPLPMVQKRLHAIYLRAQGKKYEAIAQIVGCSQASVGNWIRIFKKSGLAGLKAVNLARPQSQLALHHQTLEEHFRSNPPATVREASAKIQELTGIQRSERVVRGFLRSIGMDYRKTGRVPGKANREEQAKFKKKSLDPLLEEARVGSKEVFFADAAHFVWQGYVGFLWCFFKVWFGSPSGRRRFNVLAALNAVTHEMVTVCNDTYIDAWAVVDLLWKLRARYRETGIPIAIVLDNARYQKCQVVLFLAKAMGIQLVYLPPYSPNLNLIERVWKLIRKKALVPKNYDSFESFSSTIQDCVEQAHIRYSDELATLLTWNFQTLPEESKIAA